MAGRGDTLSHFRLLERLGADESGWWRAIDTRLEREVALRVLPAEQPAARLSQLEDAARRIGDIAHPGIVPLVAELSGETLFVITALPEGTSLTELVPPDGMLRERLLETALALTAIVAAAHDGGLEHGALEPRNVWIDRAGVIRVRGFGLAEPRRARSEELDPDEVPTLTLTRDHSGPPALAYRSPERIRGKPTDVRSDVFALGVILYEMATGRLPFAGETPADLCVAILRDPPPPVSGFNPTLPVELGRAIRRCLAKDPARRFDSARTLHLELVRLAAR